MKGRNPNDGDGAAPFGVTDHPISGNGGTLHGSAANDGYGSKADNEQPWPRGFHGQSIEESSAGAGVTSHNADELEIGGNGASAAPFTADGRPRPDGAAKLAIVDAVTQGDAYCDAKNWLAARDAYTRALVVDNTLQPVWVQLGHTAKQSGDPVGAEAAYRKALDLNPNDV